MTDKTLKLMVDDESLIWICRMCYKMAVAKEQGQDQCGVTQCGGPKKGHAFPGYRGPLKNKKEWCYRCGKKFFENFKGRKRR